MHRRQVRQHCQQGFRWSGLDDEPVAFLSHDRLVAGKFELTRDADRLIAAQALSLGYTIVTDNEKEFAHVEDLRRENWLR